MFNASYDTEVVTLLALEMVWELFFGLFFMVYKLF